MLMENQDSTPVCEESSSNNEHEEFIKKLSTKFNYNYQAFWDQIPRAKVIIPDQSTIEAASKDLVAGLFLKKKCNEIMSLAMDLSFYVKRTSTENSFVYDKVSPFVSSLNEGNDSTEVEVNLSPKGWYDQWINRAASPTTDSPEKRFLDIFSKPENDTGVSFFGSWLATVLLRLEQHQPSHVANKIIKLFQHMSIRSQLNRRGIYLDNKFSLEDWEPMLRRFSKVSLDKQKRNALYRAMVEIFKENEDIRGILNFTTLQTFFLGGMTLVTFIEKVYDTTAYGCTTLSEVMEILETPDTKESWQTYMEFLVFIEHFSKDEQFFTRYARAFDSKVFENLTYAKNMKLCNRLAVLADIAAHPEVRRYSVTNIGPTYKQLISNRKNVELLTNDDFRFCHNAADNFSLKSAIECPNIFKLTLEFYKKDVLNQQEIADEALKNAQFEQMLADKYRSFVEEQETKFRCLETEESISAKWAKFYKIMKNRAPWKPPKFAFGSLKLVEESEELPGLEEQKEKSENANAEDESLVLPELGEQEEKFDTADEEDSLSAMFAKWRKISEDKAPLEPYDFELTLL